MSSENGSRANMREWLRARGQRFIALASVLAVLAAASVVVSEPSPAWAKDYPSWSDVIDARKSVSGKKSAITRIQALLKSLQTEVEATQAEAKKKGEEYQVAEQEYFEAALRAEELQGQADEAAARAEESTRRAGQLLAQLQKTGSNDVSLTIFFDGENAEDLLTNMGRAKLVTAQSESIYNRATQDKNTAQALTDQADVAKDILEELKLKAEAAFQAAQAAAIAAEEALLASQNHKAELEAQLAALTTKLKSTEKDYLAGVQASYGAGAGAGGPISASGWTKPSGGYVSSHYGNRYHPIANVWRLHAGTDLAPGCNSPIWAAHSGTVVYAGWYGGYGNWILIDHGNGIQTGYAHIVSGGLMVRYGQHVAVGQQIARVGTTGYSTGCHLHFEVRRNGTPINGATYLRGQGVSLG